MGVLVALGLLGAWLWTAWNNWWFDAGEARRRQAQAAAQLGLPVEKAVDLGGGVEIGLVLVPAGRFRMGVQAGESDDLGIGRQWALIARPYYIGKYEVTQEQWQKVMGTNPSSFKGPKLPVECVSWDDCQEFLNKLNGLGKDPGRFRLPTEAEWEWEWACRAGTRTRFCSGDDEGALAEYAWYGANSGGTTHPAGTRKPNAWGLHDCHGNVWEWCGDWYDGYAQGWRPRTDPMGPPSGAGRVLRGGSWDYLAGYCRSSFRGSDFPDCRNDYVGFRVAVSSSRTP
jgi:formylglycine-generating enzyme required for sulfatase activity